jgi:hypothetical protein
MEGHMKIRNLLQSRVLPPLARGRLAAALGVSTLALSGCYVMPVGHDAKGNPQYLYSPVPVVPAPVAVAPGAQPGGAMPAVLGVKLYPINDLANQTGVLTGQVTNLMTGQGRFSFNYQGETLVGEATRVANDERRGIAAAHGQRGTFARCEYQMSSPLLGAGTCTFSNGAQYQLHVGR